MLKSIQLSVWFVMFFLMQFAFAQGPMINAGPDVTICLPGSTTLTATVVDIRDPTAYTQTVIPYTPGPFSGGSTVSLSDDTQSGSIPITFPFCFFGISYTNCIIGSNNWLGFVTGQTSTWVTVPIPNNTGGAPRGTIMGPWQDINPGIGGTVRYYVDGVAPFRRFVLAYQNVPMFSCTSQSYTSQIQIYETTNIIETHIQNKPICTTWNSGNAVHGLHHPNGLIADVVAGRNNSQWSTSNEGRRWTPSGPASYTVSWFALPGNTPVGTGLTVNVSPQTTTTYRAVVTYACTNVSFADTVVVNAASVPPPPLNGTLNICPNGTGSYSTVAVPGATYNWITPNGNITSGQGTTNINVQWGSIPGKVIVQVGSGGCAATDSLNVNIYPPPVMNIFGSNSPYCQNSLPVNLTATPAGGTFSGPGMSGSSFSPGTANAGTHTITYSLIDVNACLNTHTISIVVVPVIGNNSISAPQTICAGSNPAQLSGLLPTGGNGLIQYQWESSPDNITWIPIGGGNSQDYTPGILNANTFFRRQVVSGPCIDNSNAILITTDPVISNNTIQANQSICTGQTPNILTGSTPLGGTGTYQFLWEESTDQITWSNANGTNTSSTFAPPALFTTTYYRRVVSSGACNPNTSGEIRILVNPIPNVITTDATICLGQAASISASGNLPGGTYLWSPGAQTQGTISVNPTITTTYDVTYTLNGCTSRLGQSVVTVNIPPSAVITPLGTTDLCPGASVTLSAPLAASYTWSHDPNLNQQTVTVSQTGTYGLTFTDANGCISTCPPISVTVHTNPFVSTDSREVSCFGGNDGTLLSSVQQGTAPFIYAWTPGGYNTPQVSGVTAGSYTLTVTDAYGCIGTSGVSVMQPPVLTAVALLERNVSCPGGTDGSANVSANGGNGGYAYTWSNGQNGTRLNNVPAGNYSVIVTDSKGCTNTQQILISEPAPIVINFTVVPVRCFGEENGAATAVPNGGTSPYFFRWNTLPEQTTPTAVNLPKGNYSVIVTDMNGCTKSASTPVGQPDSLVASVTLKDPTCFRGSDGTATAQVTGGNGSYSYRWDTNPNQLTQTANNLPAGKFKVTVWDPKGCVDTSWARLSQPAPIPNPIVFGDTVCFDEAARLSVASISGTKTLWFDAQNSQNFFRQSSTFETPKLKGSRYWFVEYENDKGCRSIRVPVGAIVNNPPMAQFTVDKSKYEIPDAIAQFSITTHSAGIANWFWEFGDGNIGNGMNPVHQYEQEGKYDVTLTVVDSAGCRNIFTKSNYVEVNRFVNVIVPNAFSPNGDGINDYFNVQYRLIKTFEIKIFDRWGNQVYQSQDINFRWDGSVNGTPAPEGTYVFIVTGTTTTNDPVEVGGSFTLIR
jgi:gliding motility-associated-like protein